MECLKVVAMYIELADQIIPQSKFPGIEHNRAFAAEWWEKLRDALILVEPEPLADPALASLEGGQTGE